MNASFFSPAVPGQPALAGRATSRHAFNLKHWKEEKAQTKPAL